MIWLFACAVLLAAGDDEGRTAPPLPALDKPRLEKPRPEPLSTEDAELVKELAVLERLELLQNLELFEAEKDEPKPPQRQE